MIIRILRPMAAGLLALLVLAACSKSDGPTGDPNPNPTGNGWAKLAPPTTLDLKSVFFLDANTGWVAADSGTVLKTTDGGKTWATQSTGSTESLFEVQFLD